MPPDDLELAFMRHQFRLDALDEWRKDVDGQLRDIKRDLRDMVTAQEVADAVASKLAARNRLELTLMQKLVGFAFAGASFASMLHGLGAF